MSELPQIDSLKVAEKDIQKLESLLKQSRRNESTLETLAEALRDERDEVREKLAEAERKLSEPVHDITSLPDGR